MPTTTKSAAVSVPCAGDLQCPQWTRGQAASGQAGRHLPPAQGGRPGILVSGPAPPRPGRS